MTKAKPPGTEEVPRSPPAPGTVRGFQLTVVDGVARGGSWRNGGDRCSLGSDPANDFVIDDPTVSRFHCEIVVDGRGAKVRDQGSRNGTIVDGVRIESVWLKSGSQLTLGRTVIRFDLLAQHQRLRLSERSQFGSMVGASVVMRVVFDLLERAAASDATVLLDGETGTGKGAAAESLHQASGRAAKPFVVVDCGALPPNLLDSELFGHEKGAFTGADARRIGALEEGDGGSLFLDEIGELPADLQPKLLRVLENREVRRLGQNAYRPVDVRVIAATNRDLRAEVNAGRFRADLYFRLAVVKVTLPPLRQRADDIPGLARTLLEGLGARPAQIDELLGPELVAAISEGAWPGNVRELRNYLERCLVLQEPLPVGETVTGSSFVDPSLGYAEARVHALQVFEREYVAALLASHGGKVAAAARAAGMARVHLYRLIRRHGLRP